jgi:hypothetical protein
VLGGDLRPVRFGAAEHVVETGRVRISAALLAKYSRLTHVRDAWWVRRTSGPWSHSLPTTCRGSSSSPAVLTEADAENG